MVENVPRTTSLGEHNSANSKRIEAEHDLLDSLNTLDFNHE